MSFETRSDRPSFVAGQQGPLIKPQKFAANVSLFNRSLLHIAATDTNRHEYAGMRMPCLNMLSGSAVLLQQVLQHYLLLGEWVQPTQMMARELPPLACHTPGSWSTLIWVASRRCVNTLLSFLNCTYGCWAAIDSSCTL